MCNDSKIKVEPPAMVRTSPVAPRMNGLQETGCQQLTHLYETDEQSGYIATPFDNEPKIFAHRSSPPLYLIYKLGTTRNCVVTADFSR